MCGMRKENYSESSREQAMQLATVFPKHFGEGADGAPSLHGHRLLPGSHEAEKAGEIWAPVGPSPQGLPNNWEDPGTPPEVLTTFITCDIPLLTSLSLSRGQKVLQDFVICVPYLPIRHLKEAALLGPWLPPFGNPTPPGGAPPASSGSEGRGRASPDHNGGTFGRKKAV